MIEINLNTLTSGLQLNDNAVCTWLSLWEPSLSSVGWFRSSVAPRISAYIRSSRWLVSHLGYTLSVPWKHNNKPRLLRKHKKQQWPNKTFINTKKTTMTQENIYQQKKQRWPNKTFINTKKTTMTQLTFFLMCTLRYQKDSYLTIQQVFVTFLSQKYVQRCEGACNKYAYCGLVGSWGKIALSWIGKI